MSIDRENLYLASIIILICLVLALLFAWSDMRADCRSHYEKQIKSCLEANTRPIIVNITYSLENFSKSLSNKH